ncbi:hypothetical protein CU098_009330 [Rhizopus stolonifer]|uniref:Uncharacterized protein n=1 Tax=Rhizopus stolonifer TaxID=4846 RepID=A0A367JRR3_RHIST|nr:hypothetical protein CU098_009330 [Rhizopus stolonifer]
MAEEIQQLRLKLEDIEQKRHVLWEQTVALNTIQLEQQKSIETFLDFIHQLVEKNPRLLNHGIKLPQELPSISHLIYPP